MAAGSQPALVFEARELIAPVAVTDLRSIVRISCSFRLRMMKRHSDFSSSVTV
jgi:hypothetical protein